MAEVRLGRGPGDSDGLDEPVLVDAGVLAGIAGLLVATQLLVPPSVQAQMAFDHQAFDLWTLWTYAFVHNGIGHLLGNVVGFLAAAGVAYVICRAIDARRWFLWSTAAFLTVLPVLVSLTSYAVLGLVASGSETVERGFSGVVAGYVGLIFVAFVVWVARQSGRGVAQAVGQAVVLVLLWLLSVIYAGGFNLAVSGLVVLGFGLSGVLLVRVVAWPAVWEQWEEWWPDLRIGVGIVVVLLMFVVALFPEELVSGRVTTNIFAHGAGILWGGALAGVSWGLQYWSEMQTATTLETPDVDVVAELKESIQQTYRMLLVGAAGGLIANYVSGGVADSALTVIVGFLLLTALLVLLRRLPLNE